MIDIGKSLNEFTNSLIGAGNTAVNIGNDMLEKQAQIDLFNSEAKLQEDTDAFMEELQQDGKYEEWGDKTSDFLNKIKGQFSDPSSPYYCRNNYTAQKFGQALKNAEIGLKSKVNSMALSMQKDESNAKTQQTLQYYTNTMKGQAGIDASIELINLNREKNNISPSQATQLKAQAVTNFAMKDYQESYQAEWNKTPGASESEIEARVEANFKGYTVDGDSEYASKVDLTEAKSKGMKAAKASIAQTQEDNYQKFIRTNTNLRDSVYQAKDNPGQLQAVADSCNTQLNYYKSLPKGYITEDRRRQLMEELHVTMSLAKASGGSGSKVNADDIDNILKDAAKTGDSFFLRGFIGSSTEREGVINQYVIDQVRAGKVKGLSADASEEEIAKAVEERHFILDSYNEAFAKKLQEDPRYAGETAKYNSIVADIKKHPENYSNTAITYLTALYNNILTNTNIDLADHEGITKQLEDTRSLITLNKAGILFMNKKGVSTYKNGQYGYGAQALNNYDVVTRDIYTGKEVFTDSTTEKQVKNIVEDQRGLVGRALGISDEEAKDLQYHFERTDKNDYKSSVIWELGDKRVKIEPVNNGKDYRIVDVNTGNEIAKPQTASERSAAAKHESDKKQNLLNQEKIFTGNSELKTTATRSLSVDTIPDAVKAAGLKWSTGKHNDAVSQEVVGTERASSLGDTVKYMYDLKDKHGQAAFKALGITSKDQQEYFNTLPKEDRIQIILGQKQFKYPNN